MKKIIFTALLLFLFQRIGTAQEIDFSETELMFFGEETVTAASRREETVQKASSVVTVIYRDEIIKKGFQTLADVFESISGFFNEDKEERKLIFFRGIMDSILVVIDGVPQIYDSNRAYVPVDYEFSLLNVKRIEISRSPGTTMWGPNAFSCVVNIITLSGKDADGVSVSTGVGSYSEKLLEITAGKELKGIELYGSTSFRQGREPTLFFENAPQKYALFPPLFKIVDRKSSTGQNQKDSFFEIYGKAKHDKFNLSGRYSDFTDFSQLSLFSHGILDKESNGSRGAKTMFFQAMFEPVFDKFRLKAQMFSFKQWGHEIIRLFPKDQGHMEGGSFILDSDLSNIGANIQTDYDITYDQKISLGLQTVYNNTEVESDFQDPKQGLITKGAERTAKNLIFSVYSQYDILLLRKFLLTAGLSFDKHSDFEGAFNPKTGLSIFPTKNLTFKLLYGQAIRTPDQFDLFGITQGVYYGNISTAESNEDLKPEKINTVQATILYYNNRDNSMDITWFYSRIDNLIQRIVKEKIITAVNSGKNDFFGWEINSQTSIFSNFKGYLSYAFIAGYHEKGEPYYSVPEHTGSLGFTWEPCPYFEGSMTVHGASERKNLLLPHSSNKLWAYTVTDLSLTVKDLHEYIKFSVAITNLFNKDYYHRNEAEQGINEQVLIPGEPRTIFLKLTGKL